MGCVIQTGRPTSGLRVWGPCCRYFLYVLKLCPELFHILPCQNLRDSSVCVGFQPSDCYCAWVLHAFQSLCLNSEIVSMNYNCFFSCCQFTDPRVSNVGHYRQRCKNLKSLGLICPNNFYVMLAVYAALLNNVKRQEQCPCSAFFRKRSHVGV